MKQRRWLVFTVAGLAVAAGGAVVGLTSMYGGKQEAPMTIAKPVVESTVACVGPRTARVMEMQQKLLLQIYLLDQRILETITRQANVGGPSQEGQGPPAGG